MYGFMRLLSRWYIRFPSRLRHGGEAFGENLLAADAGAAPALGGGNLLLTDLCKDRGRGGNYHRRSAQRLVSGYGSIALSSRQRRQSACAESGWHGFEILDEIAASGRGCVLAAGHTDNWEVLGAAVGSRWPDKVPCHHPGPIGKQRLRRCSRRGGVICTKRLFTRRKCGSCIAVCNRENV